MKKITIGTRGSKLALWQANWVRDTLIEWNPGIEVVLEIIKTQGDKILDVPLAKVGGKGLFVKEIEDALLNKKIDLAVHSMKDVPTEHPEELILTAITKREDPTDAIISRNGEKLSELKDNAKIGTSSLRRRTQLLNLKPNFEIFDLRGNLDTRLRKLEEGQYDAILLATSGLNRMGWAEKISESLPCDIFLPAIGQGALGIETRKNDEEIIKLVSKFNHRETAITVTAERAFLKRLEGGCQVPIAAFGTITGDELLLEGLVGSVDGKKIIREKKIGTCDSPEKLGISLAETMLNLGADKILNEVYERGDI